MDSLEMVIDMRLLDKALIAHWAVMGSLASVSPEKNRNWFKVEITINIGNHKALEYYPVVVWVLFRGGTFSGKMHPTWLVSTVRQIKRCIICLDWRSLLGGVRLAS